MYLERLLRSPSSEFSSEESEVSESEDGSDGSESEEEDPASSIARRCSMINFKHSMVIMLVSKTITDNQLPTNLQILSHLFCQDSQTQYW